jgi:hypothetical protein
MSRTKAGSAGNRSKVGMSDVPALRAQNERLRAEVADLALKNEELREKLAAPATNRAGGTPKKPS